VHARAGTGPFGIDCDLPRWGLKLAERGGGAARKLVVSLASSAPAIKTALPRLTPRLQTSPWRNKPDDSLQYC